MSTAANDARHQVDFSVAWARQGLSMCPVQILILSKIEKKVKTFSTSKL
jgi:hypothetical protein